MLLNFIRATDDEMCGPHCRAEILRERVSACHNLLAMEIAGLPGGRLYPGSWSEWIADPSRPQEKS